jgi:hypothetical protein
VGQKRNQFKHISALKKHRKLTKGNVAGIFIGDECLKSIYCSKRALRRGVVSPAAPVARAVPLRPSLFGNVDLKP